MAVNIHPTAIVEKGAELDADVEVGAFAYIGPRAIIGSGTRIHHHATVERFTIMGVGNEVYPYAYIGGMTQDLKYEGGEPGLKIGDNNLFREFTSIHIATKDGDFTTIGSNNVFLGYAHVAHECHVGDSNILSGQTALGGHVTIADHVNIGWSSGIHQFCHIGSRAMIGACSKVVQDVPPYMICDGNPGEVRTVNKVGLKRAGFSDEDITVARRAYKALYREGLNRTQAVEKLTSGAGADNAIVRHILAFIEASERGLA